MSNDSTAEKREHYQGTIQAEPPRVEMSLQVLRKRLDEFDAAFETLELRLAPVLRRTNVSTGAGKMNEVNTLAFEMSPLAENIIVSGDRVEIFVMRIEDILKLLEV